MNGVTEFQRFLGDREALREFDTWRADFIAKGVRRRARTRIRGGIVGPSAFAIFRLITSSKGRRLVNRQIGGLRTRNI